MKLTELEPTGIQRIDDTSWWREVPFEKADGVRFLCPKCFTKNGGPIGTHSVLCWKPHVPQTTSPKPGRWSWEGTSFENLTLVAGSSSVLLTSGCLWHGFIRNGEVTNA